ncbi:hypothetical protein CHLRE_05g236350v5 [Chlamydomonas reinhardtii]|uniref:Ankyrin repeat domain-containing protein n=1 Tax=Chlamydomonas reinhardtii TaxID=3055 RepID=A0A2K3DSS8_CHLRE|nr:uncharacterized protein CHLRE_05g236350v5 [Chlamydomonas reinhardtii]PNW83596.1 hypothetical protein CHLRE_05g236350v5 [Chlamydomonas reinhardtii]
MAHRQRLSYCTRSKARLERDKWQRVWIPELVERIASFLPQNEVLLTLRLVDKTTAELLSQHRLVKAWEPLPAHALCRLHPAELEQLRNRSASERRQLVCAVAATGSLEAVDAALEATQLTPGAWLVWAAARAEGLRPGVALALCKRLCARGCPVEGDPGYVYKWYPTLQHAAKAGNADVCEWLLARGRCRWLAEAVYNAAAAGHVGLVRVLLARCPGECKRMLRVGRLLASAAGGYPLPALEELYNHWLGTRRAQLRGRGQRQAASRGPVNFGPAFDEEGPDGFHCSVSSSDFERVLAAAAGSPMACWLGKLDALLQWHCGDAGPGLLARSPSVLDHVFGAAMEQPDGLSRVRLMWEQRGWRPQDLRPAAAAAAARGDMPGLRHLYGELGVTTETRQIEWYDPCAPLKAAAQAGHLSALQLLLCTYRQGCTSKAYDQLVKAAAERGHVDIVRWLIEQPAPLVVDMIMAEVPGADRERVEMSVRRSAARMALDTGVCGGRPEVVRCVLQLGMEGVAPGSRGHRRSGSNSWTQAALSGSAATLQAMAEAGYAVYHCDLYETAAPHLAVLRMLCRLRCRGPGAHLALAALLEDPAVPLSELRWLLEGDDDGAVAGPSRAAAPSRDRGRRAGNGGGGAAEGPAAEALRYEGEWQQAVEAAGRRGRGRESRELRVWLQAWRQAQQGSMLPGRKPTYITLC